jgi:hypothetical protein
VWVFVRPLVCCAVAEAPRNTGRKVQTLTELDSEVRFQIRGAPVRLSRHDFMHLLVHMLIHQLVSAPAHVNAFVRVHVQHLSARPVLSECLVG